MKTLSEIRKERTVSLNEGGNAVTGVTRINQENSIPTVKALYKEFLPMLKLKESDTAILGSTGKKAPKSSSGDIDVALSSKALLKSNKIDSYKDIMDYIVSCIKKKGYQYKDMRQIGIVSFAYPISNEDGLQAGETVQVDFMIVQDVKYAAWSFFSPSYLESEFKGLYRNELNFFVAKNAELKVNKIDPETNTPIEWSRYWYDNKDGLMFGRQTNVSAKTGKIVKSVRSIEKKTISFDPDEIVAFLYGPKYKAKDILTFEQCLKAILSPSFPNKSKRKLIFSSTAEGLQSKGVPVPEMLAKLI